jgi:hypothetical protein
MVECEVVNAAVRIPDRTNVLKLIDMLKAATKEHGDTFLVQLNLDGCYGSDIVFDVVNVRPETYEEFTYRMAEEDRKRGTRYREYLKLKSEFEP